MSLLSGLPHRHFAAISADVPWNYVVRSETGLGRSAEQHYDTMSLVDILRLDVGAHAAPDCHLFFWVTGPFLANGAHVPIMRAWGFEPTAVWAVWLKITLQQLERGFATTLDDYERMFKMGMGHTTRQNAEYVVLGRRGNPRRLSKSIRQIIIEPAREHSRKPERFYRRVEQYCVGPYLDLFGRMQRPNWTVRGDESTKFNVGGEDAESCRGAEVAQP